MDTTTIELPGCEIAAIESDGETVRVRFEKAYIIKTMTGSRERTRWWQQGDLVFEGAEIEGEIPPLPGRCAGGDVIDNIYTYRDMIPIPLATRGRAGCALRFEGWGGVLRVRATAARLEMVDRPYYIEHLRAQ